jgi:hypothetical protein
MLLKTADDKSSLIRQLENLQNTAPAEKKKAVEQALLNLAPRYPAVLQTLCLPLAEAYVYHLTTS